jgi:putative hydrolase
VKIIADLHTHTTYSHGKGTVLDNVTTALALGLKAVGITDHGPRSAPWVRASVADFQAMFREVRALDRRAVGLRVLAGAECNITSMKGDLDVPLGIRRQLDIVLAGLHPGIMPKSGRDWLALTGRNWAAKLNPGWGRRARTANTKAVVEAVLRNQVDVITHPGYHLDIDTVELARACAHRHTALEINARHHEMTVEYVKLAAREGVKFVIGSDAHNPGAVGNLAHGVAVAKAAGLTEKQVLNAEGGGLFEWLELKRQLRIGRSDWQGWGTQPPLDRVSPGRRQSEQPEEGDRQRSYFADWASQSKPH